MSPVTTADPHLGRYRGRAVIELAVAQAIDDVAGIAVMVDQPCGVQRVDIAAGVVVRLGGGRKRDPSHQGCSGRHCGGQAANAHRTVSGHRVRCAEAANQ